MMAEQKEAAVRNNGKYIIILSYLDLILQDVAHISAFHQNLLLIVCCVTRLRFEVQTHQQIHLMEAPSTTTRKKVFDIGTEKIWL